MDRHLPLFPLQLVVFPGEDLNLHVFEPRYKQLILDIHNGNKLFGIPTRIKERQMEYGTIVKLDRISKLYPDGKMDIRCTGKEIFRLDNFQNPYKEKLYAAGEVTLLDNIDDYDFQLNEKLIHLLEELYKFMNINRTINKDPLKFKLYDAAHKIGLTVNQEYQLLSILSARERQEFGIEHLESLLPVVRKMELMRRKIQMNGHFKNIPS